MDKDCSISSLTVEFSCIWHTLLPPGKLERVARVKMSSWKEIRPSLRLKSVLKLPIDWVFEILHRIQDD